MRCSVFYCCCIGFSSSIYLLMKSLVSTCVFCLSISGSGVLTMSFITIFSFSFIIQIHFINNVDFGDLERYTILHKLLLEAYYSSIYEETTLYGNEETTRNKRQTASAVPILKDFDSQFEEYKSTGSSVIMKCEPAGTLTPNITWYKNNVTPVKRIDRGGVLPVTYDMWSMLLNDLVPADNGNYTCRVCNTAGCTEHVRRLTITGYPKQFPFIKKGYPGNTTVLVNDSAVLSCPTVNLTDYSVEWAKLLRGPGYNTSQEVSHRKDNKYEISYNTLTLNRATKADEGWYMCITNNTIGTDRASCFLRVGDFAKVPSNGNPRNGGGTISKWLTPTLSVLLIISLIIVMVVYFKFKSERLLKRHAVETAREVMFEQWMKVVSIETEKYNGYTPEGTLIMPRVKIEKQKLSDIINEYPVPHYTHASEYVFPTDAKWEIDRQLLILGDVLGEGEFGRVVQAKYSKVSQSDMPNVVAVKMLKGGHSDADMISFVSEVEIMKMIGKHENIINLLGCCTRNGPFYAVVEYADNGCLRDYLKKHKPTEKSGDPNKEKLQLKNKDLVQFALQVSRGMEYLASRGCIHRDLAARNVLVSCARVLKVADFGLARDVRDSDYYRKRTAGKLPVRWMSPESLCHNYYTTKSDVWSFGVLTWEILTYGNTPYANIPVHYLYNYLRMGKRMERPKNCSELMHQLIQQCCTFNPDDRPTFSELKEKLELIFSSTDSL